jgi:hypothetical protein
MLKIAGYQPILTLFNHFFRMMGVFVFALLLGQVALCYLVVILNKLEGL